MLPTGWGRAALVLISEAGELSMILRVEGKNQKPTAAL
jgi:hypothetical protein